MRPRLVVPILALCLCGGTGGDTRAQDVPLPAELHYLLLAKAISFDRAASRFGDELVIAVVYQNEFADSREVATTFVRAAAKSPATSVNGIPVRVVKVILDDNAKLAAQLRSVEADVVYITPLRAVRVADVVAAAHQQKAMTCSGVPAHVGYGAALALSRKGERGHLLVALERARAEGSDYDARLLSWAEVVK